MTQRRGAERGGTTGAVTGEPVQPTLAPGKRTLVEALGAGAAQGTLPAQDGPVATQGPISDDAVHAAAARGTVTSAPVLPDRDAIQRAFGRPDISSVQAHLGGEPAESARSIGAAAPVQMRGPAAPADEPGAVHRAAADGLAGAAAPLPHLERIQQSFGGHDVRQVEAHVGGPAAEAAGRMGALAYATGNAVAFQSPPDLHTAAHEAAHVVQQRAGVHLKDDVGAVGDIYEQHADQVADLVVQGRSAQHLLDAHAPRRAGAPSATQAGPVQRTLADAEKYATSKYAKRLEKGHTSFTFKDLPGMVDFALADGGLTYKQFVTLCQKYVRPDELASDDPSINLEEVYAHKDVSALVAAIEAATRPKVRRTLAAAGIKDQHGMRQYIADLQPDNELLRTKYNKAQKERGKEKRGKDVSISRAQATKLRDSFVTGGETEHSGLGLVDFDGNEADAGTAMDDIAAVTTHFRHEQDGGVESTTADDLKDRGNYASAFIQLWARASDGTERRHTRTITFDHTVDIFSSGSADHSHRQLRPRVVTMGAKGATGTRNDKTVDAKREERWRNKVGGRDTRVLIGAMTFIEENFRAATNAGMYYNSSGQRAGKQQAAATPEGHSHSEQVVVLAMQAGDQQLADWIDSLGVEKIAHMTLNIFSERAMCNNCSTICNLLMSKFGEKMPRTWARLKANGLVYFPTTTVASRLAFNANTNRLLNSKATKSRAAVTVDGVEGGGDVLVGGYSAPSAAAAAGAAAPAAAAAAKVPPEWRDVDNRDRLRSQVHVEPPSGKQIADMPFPSLAALDEIYEPVSSGGGGKRTAKAAAAGNDRQKRAKTAAAGKTAAPSASNV
jgi:hypothetical protein